ncbi:MAG: transposase [Anaerolineales bacterium]
MIRRSAPKKTLRYRLHLLTPQSGAWLVETKKLFNHSAEWYFGVFEAYPDFLNLKSNEVVPTIEKKTHRTKHNPRPKIAPPAEIGALPAYVRRAAIMAAFGSAKSFFSNLNQWKDQKEKFEEKATKKKKKLVFRVRPPVPPRVWNRNPSFYQDLYKNFTGKNVMLKLWTGSNWAWVKFGITGREVPDGWSVGSPQAINRNGHWYLHVPIQKDEYEVPKKVEEQRKEKEILICVVDLNIGRNFACCTIQNSDGTILATLYIRGAEALHGRRKRDLGRVAVRRSQTGILQPDVQDNQYLWRHIRAMGEYEAHRVSRRIVDFAVLHEASVIVFEHLGHFQPHKGKYSARGNEKRSYWLRGKIVQFSKYKAWNEGKITCRVNPAGTSRFCYWDGTELVRFTPGQPMVGYTEGAPMVYCPTCHHLENADRHSTRNIGHRFFFPPKPSPKWGGVRPSAHERKLGKRVDVARPTMERGKARTGWHRPARLSPPTVSLVEATPL